MHHSKYIKLLILPLIGAACAVFAATVYQQPAGFVAEAFGGTAPAPEVVWIDKTLRADIKRILGHEPGMLRMRYWRRDQRTVWILEEIGKDLPITTGIIVQDGAIESVRVLIFRESRGWEVRHPFFTSQFSGARLTGNEKLDRQIDGITGATLSVRALRKQARLALFLNQQTNTTRVTAQKTPR